jgi:hypothetical protein
VKSNSGNAAFDSSIIERSYPAYINDASRHIKYPVRRGGWRANLPDANAQGNNLDEEFCESVVNHLVERQAWAMIVAVA